jgi:hypothetical protein
MFSFLHAENYGCVMLTNSHLYEEGADHIRRPTRLRFLRFSDRRKNTGTRPNPNLEQQIRNRTYQL